LSQKIYVSTKTQDVSIGLQIQIVEEGGIANPTNTDIQKDGAVGSVKTVGTIRNVGSLGDGNSYYYN
jgi:hypothetical protein